jgi:hypothetical protein
MLTYSGVVDAEEFKIPSPVTSTSPALTGILNLLTYDYMEHILRPLLDLPGGLRFRSLVLAWCNEQELSLVTEFVTACSDTLECLDIGCEMYSTLGPVSRCAVI